MIYGVQYWLKKFKSLGEISEKVKSLLHFIAELFFQTFGDDFLILQIPYCFQLLKLFWFKKCTLNLFFIDLFYSVELEIETCDWHAYWVLYCWFSPALTHSYIYEVLNDWNSQWSWSVHSMGAHGPLTDLTPNVTLSLCGGLLSTII